VRALSWNLYHGRAAKPVRRALLTEFAAALAGWEWDVALLQEVPPWWPAPLAVACGAQERHVLTSRNLGLPVRRAISVRDPERLKANGGGCNAILVRGASVRAHRRVRLTWWPERRWAHGVLVDGLWVVNLHASTHREDWAQRDVQRAAVAWPGSPLLLGGDFNLRRPVLPGFDVLGGNHVDFFLARGLQGSAFEVLERGPLSDHPPIRVSF
jgi:endonuclease/exonuclease/phosphatase family metal-dependent hydrolase